MHSPLGFIHPTSGVQSFLSLPVELGSNFNAFGGSLLLQSLAAGACHADHSDEESGDDD
jgi:hypothetical protein